jgi:hypothetical protein
MARQKRIINRLQAWAAWVDGGTGGIRSARMDGMPRGSASAGSIMPVTADIISIRRTHKAVMQLSSEDFGVIKLVYLLAPRANQPSSVRGIAEWIDMPETSLRRDLEHAEGRLADILDGLRPDDDAMD